MEKYEIVQEIGKGSYGAVYKIKKVNQNPNQNDLLSSQEQVNKL
jgi:serine/threonine protein kinase